MTPGLRMPALSVVPAIGQSVVASHAASLQGGYGWLTGPRGEKMPPLWGVAGRLGRAPRNFVETFPLFAAVALAAHSRTRTTRSPSGVRGSTFGLASRTCSSMQPEYR